MKKAIFLIIMFFACSFNLVFAADNSRDYIIVRVLFLHGDKHIIPQIDNPQRCNDPKVPQRVIIQAQDPRQSFRPRIAIAEEEECNWKKFKVLAKRAPHSRDVHALAGMNREVHTLRCNRRYGPHLVLPVAQYQLNFNQVVFKQEKTGEIFGVLPKRVEVKNVSADQVVTLPVQMTEYSRVSYVNSACVLGKGNKGWPMPCFEQRLWLEIAGISMFTPNEWYIRPGKYHLGFEVKSGKEQCDVFGYNPHFGFPKPQCPGNCNDIRVSYEKCGDVVCKQRHEEIRPEQKPKFRLYTENRRKRQYYEFDKAFEIKEGMPIDFRTEIVKK